MSACGTCALCCKIMGVPELEKPRNRWCRHCDHRSCGIYADRPQSCRDFECLWLQSQERPDARMPDEMRPDRSRVVLTPAKDGTGLIVHVDPGRPDAWRRPAIRRLIQAFVAAEAKVVVAIGERRLLLDRWRGCVEAPKEEPGDV